jgi:DNA-binding response OmpR family regulator
MPKKVAIIEDEAELAALLEYNLGRQGLTTRVISSSKGAVEQLEIWKPDLIILDVMLPDGDGFDLCRRMRKTAALARIPVLFLTARSDEVDRVLGLEIGGDDYVTKPFSPRELTARVKAHLRRGEQDDTESTSAALLRTGPFTLDRAAHRLSLRDEELALTSTEFRLLEFFLMHPGRAYNREQLLEEVWGHQNYVSPRTVDVHIRRLRERIEEQPDDPRYLTTVRGFGYRFEAPQ